MCVPEGRRRKWYQEPLQCILLRVSVFRQRAAPGQRTLLYAAWQSTSHDRHTSQVCSTLKQKLDKNSMPNASRREVWSISALVPVGR
jgi:hypothetical protein